MQTENSNVFSSVYKIIKNKFNNSYKDIDDNQLNKVLDYIEFLKNNSGSFIKNESIPSIYNCVCTNVTTNYTPEGFWVALRDGRPVSYTLSLAFTETKKITQEDIEEGY